MNSRERTYLALDHQTGDRLPIDFWASARMIAKIGRDLVLSYTQFLDRHDVDLRYIAGPAYVGPTLAAGADIWGVERTQVEVKLEHGVESYSEVAASPLAAAATVADVLDYPHWPSPDWFDYSVVAAQCREIRQQGRVVVFMGDRLNRVAQLKPAMYLRGMENIFMDLALRQDIAAAVIGKIREFYLVYLQRLLEAAEGMVDIVLTGDDFGSQNGLMLSPADWREFIRPGFAEYLGLIKEHDVKAMHHTCGSVAEIIPDLIDCGLDVLQSVQPEAKDMGLAELIPRFGERLCFHGGVSIQRTMPFGTPDDVRAEVGRIADLVGDRGGYIFCTSHNVQTDCPLANVSALLAAYRESGARPSE